MPPALMMHKEDPRDTLMREVGDISEIEIFADDVLVAIYRRPEKTKGGIIMTDVTRGEDVYQGKVGLILKMGPMAEQDTGCRPGDWCWFRPADGWSVTLTANKTPARVIRAALIRGRCGDPDLIY